MNYFCPNCSWKGLVLERTPRKTDKVTAILKDGKAHDKTELLRATRIRAYLMEELLNEMETAKKITRYKMPTAGRAIEFVKAIRPFMQAV
jgi:DNA-directed RNA polymerase subunit RPC12/RpoP